MQYFDKNYRRLVYIEQRATSEFWDRQWEDDKLKQSILAGSRERFVFPWTKRYLKTGTKILEGGCGKGQFVYSLHTRGYEAWGVDYAQKTIEKVITLFPELKLRLGDVREINFPDSFFDGYWSLGVIEHFPEGYDAISHEMLRVLKPGGYLFLTFPHMSPLRRLKVFLGFYPLFDKNNFDREHFYQFALDNRHVIRTFENIGFKLVKKNTYEGFKGFKDEIGSLRSFFQIIYDNKSFVCRILSHGFSLALAPFASHMTLLVLRKK